LQLSRIEHGGTHGNIGSELGSERLIAARHAGCLEQAGGGGQAAPEACHPSRAIGGHRLTDKVFDSGWQDHMELGPSRQKHFGNDDVGTGCQRPIAKSCAGVGQCRRHRRRQCAMIFGRDTKMARIVDRSRRSVTVEPFRIGMLCRQDQRQLAHRRCVIRPAVWIVTDRLS